MGRLLWDNLADFPGEMRPVCQAATVGGRLAYADLRDVPDEVDLADIATPAATVPDIVRAAADKGVAAVVVQVPVYVCWVGAACLGWPCGPAA